MKFTDLSPWRSSLSSSDRDRSRLERGMGDLLRAFGNERDFFSPFEFDTAVYPPVDVRETSDGYSVEADLPGMSDKDIELELKNNVLCIKGEKTAEKVSEAKKGNGFIRNERTFGAFKREIAFDDEINAANVEAQFRDGVLRVNLKKKEPVASKHRKIPIQH